MSGRLKITSFIPPQKLFPMNNSDTEIVREEPEVNIPLRIQSHSRGIDKLQMLQDKLDEIKSKEQHLTIKQVRCKYIYYSLGLISLVLSIVISTATSSYETLTTEEARYIFICSLISSVVAGAVNFLGIESKISTYDQLRKLYHKFSLQIADELQQCDTSEEAEQKLHEIITEQMKIEAELIALGNHICCC